MGEISPKKKSPHFLLNLWALDFYTKIEYNMRLHIKVFYWYFMVWRAEEG